jgi:SP family facilitated glucose transporter-like MFS transporter 8
MLGTLNQVMLCMGLLVCDALGAGMRKDGVCDWRLLSTMGMVSACALTIGCIGLPESPVFLLQRGQQKAAVNAVRRIRRRGFDAEAEVARMMQQMGPAGGEREGGGFAALCDPDLRMPLLIACALMLFQQFSGINAVIFYAGTIFESAGVQNPDTPPILMMALQVAGTVGVSWLVDRAGRRVLLISSSLGMCVASTSMGMFFYLKNVHNHNANWLALCSMFGYIASFAGGMGAIPWLIMSEIFPARVRGAASSLVTLVMWGGSFVITLTFDAMTRTLTTQGTFWAFAGVLLLAAVFVLLVVPETRGKDLEEIEQLFRRRGSTRTGRHGEDAKHRMKKSAE